MNERTCRGAGMMGQRAGTLMGGVLVALCLIGPAVCAGGQGARPNLVLIMADDQGWGETHYNGHPQLQTPTLDRMAAEGLRFDRFYAAAPVCSPTRTAVLTGRHPNRSGVFAPNYSTRPEEITIAQILRGAGYRTGHFGKWHVGAVKAASPTNPRRMGFDEYLAHDNFFELDPPLSRNGEPPEIHAGESSEIVVAAAIDFVKQAVAKREPFFTVIWFGSPHGPYRGLPRDLALYEGVASEEMRNRFAEITAMDRAIGQFRDVLDELGVAGNTLVWYTSDNGIPVAKEEDSFNGGWRGKKGTIHEGGLRVPAIIEWPAVVKSPRVTDVACVSSDILPTLLDFLDLRSPDPSRPIDGISLRSLIEDGTMRERPLPIGFWKYASGGERANGRWMDEEASRGTTPTVNNPAIDFLNFRHPTPRTEQFGGEAAWTGNRYKLIVGTSGSRPAVELYDLENDPHETRNLAAEQPERVAAMRAELENWQRSVERSLSGADYAATAAP